MPERERQGEQRVGEVGVAGRPAGRGGAGAMLTNRAEKSKIEEAKAETEREKATDNLCYMLKQLDGAVDRNKDLEAQNIELYNEIFDLKNQLISMAYLVAYIQVLRELWQEPPRIPDMPDIVRNALDRFKN